MQKKLEPSKLNLFLSLMIGISIALLLVYVFAAQPSKPQQDSTIYLTDETQEIEFKVLPTSPELTTRSPTQWLEQTFRVENYRASLSPSPNANWYKLDFVGDLNQLDSKQYHLFIGNRLIEQLDIYLAEDGQIVKQQHRNLHDPVSQDQQLGAGLGGFNFVFTIQAGQQLSVLIRKQTQAASVIPLTLYSHDAFTKQEQFQYIFWGGLAAALLVMAIYNALIYTLKPSIAYRWYLLFHFTVVLFYIAVSGFADMLGFPYLQAFLIKNLMSVTFLGILTGLRFSSLFLESDKITPKHHRFVAPLQWLVGLALLGSIIIPGHLFYSVYLAVLTVVCVFVVSMAICAYHARFRPAQYFLVSWTFTIVGATVGSAAYQNILEANFFTLNGFLIGSVLEMVLLSVALADRIKYLEENTLSQAYIDPMTNLPNFSYYTQYFPEQLKQYLTGGSTVYLMVFEISGFKELISLIGPHLLEKRYKAQIQIIDTHLKEKSWIAPMQLPAGKASYMVALPNDQLLLTAVFDDQQRKTSQYFGELYAEIKAILQHKNINAFIHLRVGTTKVEDTQTDISEYFRQTQIALQSVEYNERQIMAYHEDQDGQIQRRLSLVSELIEAINLDQFKIDIQPQVDALSGKITSGEVLLRWKNKHIEEISPSHFIPVAERSGLIFDITCIAITKACKWLRANRLLIDYHFKLGVNISILDLNHPRLLEFIDKITQEYYIAPKQLIFEVTESASMRNSKFFPSNISALKNRGFSISIDDFGTGYSSLTYIQKIRADEVKLDISFVRNIHFSATNQIILKAIIRLAHSMNMRTVAEGAESFEEVNWLRQNNCDVIQGHYFYKAQPAEEFTALYSSQL